MNTKKIALVLFAALSFFACNRENPVPTPTTTVVGEGDKTSEVVGFYLLNEGNMGTNKATIDFYDYTTGVYTKNIFSAKNPTIVDGLGDVGNDVKIYGGKLYAVINGSNLVEIMDARTAKHLGKVDIANCRNINFYNGKAYVSSYAGEMQADNTQLGFVAEIDTTTFQILRKVDVGRQPEELAATNGKLYVANSGGYTSTNYDNTLSVIDIATFKEERKIKVAVNLKHVRLQKNGKMWVSSYGNYAEIQSKLFEIDPTTNNVTDSIDVRVSNLSIHGDKAYICSQEWDMVTYESTINYKIVDLKSKQIVAEKIITDGSEQNIVAPYAVEVNPATGEILIADAKNYVSPGALYCYSSDGKLKWSVETGDIPGHIAFLTK